MRQSLEKTVYPLAVIGVIGAMIWVGVTAGGSPNPTAVGTSRGVAIFDIGVLVFREGLECILVLTAITTSLTGSQSGYRRPIAAGAAAGFVATLATWLIVVRIIARLTGSIPELDIQAATGLLAILVLLVVMNWFFHKVYWTGWISLHTQRKRRLVDSAGVRSARRVLVGFAVLGFTSLYREGFEVVLFLQSYRLRLGEAAVSWGVLTGLVLTVIVGVLTFMAQRRLPYKKMLIFTGVMLGAVLLVMVGEQAQEMQLAHWLPTTTIVPLRRVLPDWIGLWFAVFPTVESLAAQGLAALLVAGSYVVARRRAIRA
ncbi:MAG TPA: FTR1 family protein [Gemmatimonadaceae bacterium]